MSKEISRRDFLKAGAVGLAATSVLGGVNVFADEKEKQQAGTTFDGKKKFAGIGSCPKPTIISKKAMRSASTGAKLLRRRS